MKVKKVDCEIVDQGSFANDIRMLDEKRMKYVYEKLGLQAKKLTHNASDLFKMSFFYYCLLLVRPQEAIQLCQELDK